MRYVLWFIIGACVIGCPWMLWIFSNNGNPMALFNAVWCVGLIFWARWLLREFYGAN